MESLSQNSCLERVKKQICLENPDISVILSAYKKTENLPLQIEAIKKQSLKPKEILLFQDGIEDGENISIPDSVLKELTSFEISPINVGVWGRFKYAMTAKSPLICVFDDDTIPGEHWLANCYTQFVQREGIYGTVGILNNLYSNYPYSHPYTYARIGWPGNLSDTVEVDFVGHSWFLKKDWLKYLFEAPKEVQLKVAGEDMALSYECLKHGIKTYVPPHPKGVLSLWGSQPALANKLGFSKAAISCNKANLKLMNDVFQFLQNDWSFMYFRDPNYVIDVYLSLKSGTGVLKHY